MILDLTREQKQETAYRNIRDAIELKRVASAASLTTGARRIGGAIYRELRERAASYLRTARHFDSTFTRRVWKKHSPLNTEP